MPKKTTNRCLNFEWNCLIVSSKLLMWHERRQICAGLLCHANNTIYLEPTKWFYKKILLIWLRVTALEINTSTQSENSALKVSSVDSTKLNF